MSKKAIRKFLVYVIIFSILLFLTGLTFSLTKIYKEVKSISIEAKKAYNQDCVTSLIAFSKSDNQPEKMKIKAIWALGQIADDKALPYLENLNALYDCPLKEDYESYLCYEVKKAIKWCKKGNLTHYMYSQREEW